MSVPELAIAARVARTTIYRLEAGEHAWPQMRIALRLAEVLDLKPTKLMGPS